MRDYSPQAAVGKRLIEKAAQAYRIVGGALGGREAHACE